MSNKELRWFLWGLWNPIVGFAKDMSVYPRALLHRRLPDTRFVVFGLGRSGSTLLCDLLDGHSAIQCDGELFKRRIFAPIRFTHDCARLSGSSAYGFKVKIHQLVNKQKVEDVRGYLTTIHDGGWKIVHLHRKNVLRQALSNILRVKSRRSHLYQSRDGSQPKTSAIPVDIERLRSAMENLSNWRAREDEALDGLPFQSVAYEDDLYSADLQQATIRRLVEWLELTFEPVKTDLVRITPKSLRDLVENYDEVADAVTGTDFEKHLDD